VHFLGPSDEVKRTFHVIYSLLERHVEEWKGTFFFRCSRISHFELFLGTEERKNIPTKSRLVML